MRNLHFCALVLVLATGSALADPKAGDTKPADTKAAAGAMLGAAQEKATIDKICGQAPAPTARDAQYMAVIGQTLSLTDDQKKTLKDYQDTLTKAMADARSRLCDSKPDVSSFEASLNLREKMLEDQLATVKAVNPKLIAFYNGLNAEQKAKFDHMRETMVSPKHR